MSDDRPIKWERRPAEPLRSDAPVSNSAGDGSEFAPGGEPSLLPDVGAQPNPPLVRPSPRPQRPVESLRADQSAPQGSGGSSWRSRLPHDSGAHGAGSADEQTHISKRAPLTPTPGGSLPMLDVHRELEGQQLEHFQLQQLVGGGGMGAVFRALDTRLNRVVALKILAQDQAIDDEKIRRFRNEAQSAARLDHENVARVYYVGEDRGLHFIAFEFIDGTNIRDLVETRGALPVAEALTYTYQIAEALAHADSREVVHRDIKPSNVIITDEGRAKLVDMGLARLHADDRSGTDLTASGVTLGTFDYISPEQALDPRNADARSDIYSLGCTVYFMLTAQPPFPEGSPLQKLLHHHSEKPPDPRELNRTIPDDLATLVQRMMAKDPAARPASPTALVRELIQLAHEFGISLPATTTVYPAPAQRFHLSLKRQLPWLIPVAALLLIVAVLEALAIWPPGATNIASAPPAALAPSRGEPLADDRPSRTRPFEETNQANGHNAIDASPPLRGPQTPPGSADGGAANPRRPADETMSGADGNDPSTSLVPPVPSSGSNPRLPGTTGDTSAGEVTNQPSPLAGSPEANPDVRSETASASSPPAGTAVGRDAPNSRETPLGTSTANSPTNTERLPVSPDLVFPDLPVDPARQLDADRQADVLFPGFSGSVQSAAPISATAGAQDGLSGAADALAPAPVTRQNVAALPATSELPPVGRAGLRIVDPAVQTGLYVYPTLRAACAMAQDGDVIELRYNGILEERPIESRNRRLTIRAAENYRPIVRFRPTEGDPLKHPRQMVTVAGGRLTLVNLVLELDLTLAMPAEGWSLFEIQQAELLRLEHCALTVRNTSERGGPQHADVAFFAVEAPPGAATMMTQAPVPTLPTSLELQDTIARGEAVLLQVNDLQPISLTWQNGFLATGQRLLVAPGGAKEPQHAGKIQLELRHLTAVAREGLCLLTNSADAPYQLSTVIRCSDSILTVGSSGALVEQAGIDTVATFRSRLKWESDRNFYDGFSVFWKIRGKSALAAAEEMTLSPWNAFWGGREGSWGRIVWRERPDLLRPPHLQTVADFALDEQVPDNPAYRGASDGRDVGCEAALLPIFPDATLQEGSSGNTTNPARSAEFGIPPGPVGFR